MRRPRYAAICFQRNGPTLDLREGEMTCGREFVRIDIMDPEVLDTDWYRHHLRTRLTRDGAIFFRGRRLP